MYIVKCHEESAYNKIISYGENFYHFLLLHVYFDFVKIKCPYVTTGLYDFEHKKNYPFGPR